MTQLFPRFKEVAAIIASQAGVEPSFSHSELAKMLEEQPDSNGYRLAVLHLRKELSEEWGEELISVPGEGYKVASEEGKVKIASDRYHRKARNSLRRQRAVLANVRYDQLDSKDKQLWDGHVLRNGLIMTAFKKTALNRLKPGMRVEVTTDRPRLLD